MSTTTQPPLSGPDQPPSGPHAAHSELIAIPDPRDGTPVGSLEPTGPAAPGAPA